MPRFVILDHDHPFSHWDFFLEAGDALRGWRLLSEPVQAGVISAEALPDHRTHYLDYEGPVSGDRGRVIQWDAGTFDWVINGDQEVTVRTRGKFVAGTITLRRSADDRWTWEWR